jgi:hypothetical protein
MLRKLLRSPDDPAGGGDGEPTPPAAPPAPAKKPADDGKTAADVAAGGKTAREIHLEKKLSVLEDGQNALKKELEEVNKFVAAAKKAPSARKPGKTILDELDDFIFPKAPAPPPAAPPAEA